MRFKGLGVRRGHPSESNFQERIEVEMERRKRGGEEREGEVGFQVRCKRIASSGPEGAVSHAQAFGLYP